MAVYAVRAFVSWQNDMERHCFIVCIRRFFICSITVMFYVEHFIWTGATVNSIIIMHDGLVCIEWEIRKWRRLKLIIILQFSCMHACHRCFSWTKQTQSNKQIWFIWDQTQYTYQKNYDIEQQQYKTQNIYLLHTYSTHDDDTYSHKPLIHIKWIA